VGGLFLMLASHDQIATIDVTVKWLPSSEHLNFLFLSIVPCIHWIGFRVNTLENFTVDQDAVGGRSVYGQQVS
jgi:hypothetical protein